MTVFNLQVTSCFSDKSVCRCGIICVDLYFLICSGWVFYKEGVSVFSPSQLKTEFLPLLSVVFVSENSLVAAVRSTQCFSLSVVRNSRQHQLLLFCLFSLHQGHDCCPMLFRCDDGGTLTFVTKLDLPKQSIQRNISAMERFRNMDKRATTEDRNTALDTLHQNSIT